MITENNRYTKKWVVVNGIGFKVTKYEHIEIDRDANEKRANIEYSFVESVNFDQDRRYIVCDGDRAIVCYAASCRLIACDTDAVVLDERKERFRKFFKNKKGDRKWNI